VIKACQLLNDFKKLIFLGSVEEYGLIEPPFFEQQRECPVTSYGLSKLAITNILGTLKKSQSLPSIVLRPSVIYGPGQSNSMFIPSLINSLLIGKRFQMTAGNQLRDFVYIDDVIDAIVQSIFIDIPTNENIFNVGYGVSFFLQDVANLIAELISPDVLSLIDFGAVNYRKNELMQYAVNISHAEKFLGWKPKVDFEDGIRNTITFIKKSIL
jgi:nucleoside-diphosphate-sugar epimerase